MSCLLKDFLKRLALEPGEMLEKLLDSLNQDTNTSEALKFQTKSLQAKSYDLNTLYLFWGILAQNTAQFTAQDVVYHALLLDVGNINDPYSQACYSAIELYKLLKDLDNIHVYLQNSAHQQYHTIMIHTSDGHYIYDPIKDPHVLFTEDDYQAKPAQSTLLINQPLLLAYERYKEKFLNYLEIHAPSSDIKNKKRPS